MNNFSNDGPTLSLIQPQPIVDRTEQEKERKREQYAQWYNNNKDDLLARRREAYQQKKSLAGKEFTFSKLNISIMDVSTPTWSLTS
jgi:hypothetical protein